MVFDSRKSRKVAKSTPRRKFLPGQFQRGSVKKKFFEGVTKKFPGFSRILSHQFSPPQHSQGPPEIEKVKQPLTFPLFGQFRNYIPHMSDG